MATSNKPSKNAVEDLKKLLSEKKYDVQFEVSLCLSDFDKGRMRKGSNGKIYTDIIVGVRKEPDQWSRDLKVYESPTKADRENHAAKNYVGGGRMIIFVGGEIERPTDKEIEEVVPF